ncbi:head-tail connector protein [Bartonella apis]|uniref:head-tail connector protein n=1 Tax=Bartonella apis TaxID=1686310 RepID=UPI00242A8F19|nr:head-tail connector protein [Bartonella apis]
MSILTLKQVKDQLNFTDDIGDIDDDLLTLKMQAAQNYVESLLGYKIEERYGSDGKEPIPPALQEAVCQIAAWWYEQREAVGGVISSIPHGCDDIIRSFRDWTF